MPSYTINVVGESFPNDDGTDRQMEIRLCTVGERVFLERDPDNRFDANCVKVVSIRGVQIGNMSRDNAEWMAERMDKGHHLGGRIVEIGPGEGGLLGVVLEVTT